MALSTLTEFPMKILFIGGGNMASALIGGLLKRGVAADGLGAIDPNPDTLAHLATQFGIKTYGAVGAHLQDFDAIVLAVKPQVLKEVVTALAPFIGTQLIISIAAGIRGVDIARWLGGYARIVRAMPNTPALIGMGVTGLAALPGVDEAGRVLAGEVLAAVGQVVWCEAESGIDAVTAISGSGPAYVFYFIEALQQAALELGFNAEQARTLAVSTFTGAAQLAAQTLEPIGTLRERVTSKGGTTAAALASFETDQVGAAIARGALAAHRRAEEMGDEFGSA
jgi:pyrroline-5-carboxylate reductase